MRLLAFLAAMLLLMWAVVTGAARLALRDALAKPWPQNLGTIRDAPRHFPPRKTSPEAEALATAAGTVGVQIGMYGHLAHVDPIPREVENQLSLYLLAQMQKPDDSVDAPPANVA